MAGETDSAVAEAPGGDGLPLAPPGCGPVGSSELECGRIEIDAPESTRKLKLFLESFKKIKFLVT